MFIIVNRLDLKSLKDTESKIQKCNGFPLNINSIKYFERRPENSEHTIIYFTDNTYWVVGNQFDIVLYRIQKILHSMGHNVDLVGALNGAS